MSTIPNDNKAGALAAGEEVSVQGNIAARIDRLPLLSRHYAYAGITQLFWGIMIASDGIVALLYPFIWAPAGYISSFQFDILPVRISVPASWLGSTSAAFSLTAWAGARRSSYRP